MKQNLDPLGYDNVNPLICMTFDVENLPSVAHRKNQVSRDFRYARDFGSTAKEVLKCTASTSWSAYYHTSCGSWCRVPEPVHQYYSLQRSAVSTREYISKMQDWASAHGSMRERIVRQEITMARAGTVPDYLYQKEVQVREKVSFRSTSNAINRDMPHQDEPEKNTVEDEVSEFDSGSD